MNLRTSRIINLDVSVVNQSVSCTVCVDIPEGGETTSRLRTYSGHPLTNLH